MKNALVLLCLQPNKIWCDFLNNFTTYKVYIIIDDSKFDCKTIETIYPNIIFIQIDDSVCESAGYKNMNFTLKKKVTAWEKAMYYFSMEKEKEKEKEYEYLWFIEDDVFFYDETTISNIDEKYTNQDILSTEYVENKDGDKTYWNWPWIDIQYSPPYYKAMVCATRLSSNFLNCIKEYATKNNTLFFLEALFPTIAIKNNLNPGFPRELYNIHYRYMFFESDITKENLYHPVKKIIKHASLRDNLRNPKIVEKKTLNYKPNMKKRFKMF
jgi:hypothetical protein